MNEIFSFTRWFRLVRKHGAGHGRKYLLGLLAVTGIILIWFLFLVLMQGYQPLSWPVQVGTYFVVLFMVGCLFGSSLFSDLASRPRGINYLALPASQLEKTLCALLYGVVLFFITYTLVFYLADVIMVKVANSVTYARWLKNHMPDEVYRPQQVVNVFTDMLEDRHDRPNPNVMALLFFFSIQAAYILGSVYFSRFSFIKTTVSLLVLSLFIILFLAKLLGAFMPDGHFLDGLNQYSVSTSGSEEQVILLPDWVNTVFWAFVRYAMAPLLWLTTYYRVREKEI
ncbi:MAG TPA: hypothetical protein VG870_02905 [Chitinophagaceae bacterium]|nr:hypothetical protein [Chitinophagaceae bacterium]